jgi:sarcosine oxidase
MALSPRSRGASDRQAATGRSGPRAGSPASLTSALVPTALGQMVAPRSNPRCVVVGGGLLGLSAARALTRRSSDVVVLEAGNEVGHERSGSKGDARIFRLGYPERHYVEMASQAQRLWHELEARTGRTLLHMTGQVTFGAGVAAIAASMEATGAPFERLSARDVAAKFPGIATGGPALFEPDSGVLAAGECLRALCDEGGFEVRTGVRVTSLQEGDRKVSVRTATGDELSASVVVVCAGAGSLALLPPAAGGPSALVTVSPSLPQVAYFCPINAGAEGAEGAEGADGRSLPVFIEWGPHMIYGLPVPKARAGTSDVAPDHPTTYKVSHHTQGSPLASYDPSDTAALPGDDPELLALLRSAVVRLLPGLDPEPVATERCVYDNTPDSDFVIDRIGQVVVGCGTSGHGFKFGPLLGELMADLATGTGGGSHTGERFRVDLARFAVGRARRARASLAESGGRSSPNAGERR